MTGVGASYILLEKVLDVADLSMDSGRQRVNNRVLDWAMIS